MSAIKDVPSEKDVPYVLLAPNGGNFTQEACLRDLQIVRQHCSKALEQLALSGQCAIIAERARAVLRGDFSWVAPAACAFANGRA